MTSRAVTKEVCCPEFEPSLWDDRIITWKDKRFIRDHVFTLFYMPVNYGSVMRRFNKKIVNSESEIPKDGLCLADHTSKWNMDLYLAVDHEIRWAKNVTISGQFYCKVYEGPFRDTGKWCEDFERTIQTKGFPKHRLYMWYTTCPRCAKKYGKNYVAILSHIE